MSRELRTDKTGDLLRRARWRLRGAWLGPTFALCTLAESVMVHVLPLTGHDTPILNAFLLAGVLNLAVVAVFAPLGGWLMRRRRPDLPAPVAANRAGTASLLAMFALLVAIGIVNH